MKKTNMNDCWWIDVRKWMLVGLLCMISVMGYTKPNKLDSLSVRVTNVENSITVERQEIGILQKEVEVCEKSLKSIDEHVDRVNETVSNQIAASSHTIQVWGWIIAFIAFIFGYYINRMWQKSKDLKEETTTQLQQTREELQQLQKLYSDIQKNSQLIYEKLRREETISQLHRLEEIPEDMMNMEDSLLARELEKEDFPLLVNAYHNLIQRSMELSDAKDIEGLRIEDLKFPSLEDSYALQFAQHFMDKAIIDPELQAIILANLNYFYKRNFFRNDAVKSTNDFKRGVSFLDEDRQTELLAQCIDAIIESPYEKLEELYSTLLSDLAEDNIQKIWEKVNSEEKDATYFAQYLKKLIDDRKFSAKFHAKIDAYLQKAVSANAK